MIIAKDLKDIVSNGNIGKAEDNNTKAMLLSIMGGFFVSTGATAAFMSKYMFSSENHDPLMSALGSLLGAVVFPLGIILISLQGANLFTSSPLVSLPAFEKKLSWFKAWKHILIVWIGNLIGTGIMAYLVHLSALFPEYYISGVIEKKINIPLVPMFARAVITNVIVCCSVWVSMGSKSAIGKFTLLWFPIFIFVILGVEHSIANMYYFHLEIFTHFSIEKLPLLLKNLFVVTLGNLVTPFFLTYTYYRIYK